MDLLMLYFQEVYSWVGLTIVILVIYLRKI